MSKPLHFVIFTSDTGLSLKVLLDQQMANLTSGFGNWDIVQRPKRKSITRYAGADPYTMDVPVLFDGYRERNGQEAAISTLVRMAEPPGELLPPPILKIAGAVPRRDLQWVIQDMTWDNQAVIWTEQNGVPVRVRQSVVVHLLQYVDDRLIVTAPTPAVIAGGGKGGSKVKTGSGKTAKQEAQDEYGSAAFAQFILKANPWMSIDPRQPIPVGQQFIVPPVSSGP